MEYIPELKEAMLRRFLSPNNESVAKVSREEGILQKTLNSWKNEAKANGTPALTGDNADTWSTQDKFLIVVETASMNESELAEYARKKGASLSKACERLGITERTFYRVLHEEKNAKS